jgi:hypothetical protein
MNAISYLISIKAMFKVWYGNCFLYLKPIVDSSKNYINLNEFMLLIGPLNNCIIK